MQSTAQIQTQQAQRLAKRLANHWKHKFTIEETDQQFLIHFPSAEKCGSGSSDPHGTGRFNSRLAKISDKKPCYSVMPVS